MIDLHCHTTNSDGTWSTKKLLEEAEKQKIEVLSITDHDTAYAHIEIKNDIYLRKAFSGKIIIGAELNCTFNGVKIEILAYDFDIEPVQRWLENYYTVKKNEKRLIDEFEELKKLCEIKGIKLDKEISYNPQKEYPVDVIYNNMKKYEENKEFFEEDVWNDIALFFRTSTVDKKFPLYRDFSHQMPTLEFYNYFIHKHHGKIFIAHLYKYNLKNHIEYLNKITQKKLIDGIEVYHSSFSNEQIETLKEYCKEHNLIISGGSDCHGEKKANRKLGVGYGNLNINKKIIDNWDINTY